MDITIYSNISCYSNIICSLYPTKPSVFWTVFRCILAIYFVNMPRHIFCIFSYISGILCVYFLVFLGCTAHYTYVFLMVLQVLWVIYWCIPCVYGSPSKHYFRYAAQYSQYSLRDTKDIFQDTWSIFGKEYLRIFIECHLLLALPFLLHHPCSLLIKVAVKTDIAYNPKLSQCMLMFSYKIY